MSDLNAAATLTIAVDTGEAALELKTLHDRYTALKTDLANGFKAVGGVSEIVQQMRTAQAETQQLQKTLDGYASRSGQLWISYSAKIEQGRATAKKALEGMTSDQVIALSKQQQELEAAHAEAIRMDREFNAERLRIAEIQQKRDIEQYRASAAEKERIAEIQQKRDIEQYRTAAAEKERIAEIQQKRDIEQYRTAAAEKERIAEIQQKRDIEQYRTAAAEKERIAEIQQKRDIEQYRTAAAEKERIAEIQQKRDIEQYRTAAAEKERIAEIQQKRDIERFNEQLSRDKAAALWASKSREDQLRAALPAARAIEGGTNANLVSSSDAVALAQQLGSVAAVERELGKATAQVAEHQLHWNKAANEGHALARGLSGSLGTLWMTYGSLLPLLTGAALGGAFVQATKQGSEFAYQMTFVKALGQETAQTMQHMSEAALTFGKNSLQSAGEVASGFRILAQAGVEAADSVSAMASVLDLAVVGEMNMEQAAVTLVGVMNAFGLQTRDLAHIGDVFAKAAAESQTSVQGMTEAMKYASVVGEQYGASLEDTATAITLLAKMNIQGTAAGTSLRNMLKELYTPTAKAASAMKSVGLEAADAQGNLRSFADVIYDLRGKLEQFDKASQVKILQAIFGERGAKEAIAMLGQTREQWDRLNQSISQSSGFMRGVAQELEETTKGTWVQAVNTLKTTLVESFKDTEVPLKSMAVQMKTLFASDTFQQGMTNVVTLMASLAQGLVSLAPVFSGVVGTLAQFSNAIAGVATGLGTMLTIMAAARGANGLAGLMTSVLALSNPITAVALGIGAVTAALVMLQARTPDAVLAMQNFNSALDTQLAKLRLVNSELQQKLMLSGRSAEDDAWVAEKTLRKAKEDLAAAKAVIADFSNQGPALGQMFSGKYAVGSDDYKKYKEAIDIASKMPGEIKKAEQSLLIAQGYQIESTRNASKVMAQELIKQKELQDSMKVGAGKWAGADDGKGKRSDAYRAELQDLKNYISSYENEYKQFIAETGKMRTQGAITELQEIQANSAARLSYLNQEISKAKELVARARSEGSMADASKYLGQIAELEAKRERLAAETDKAIEENRTKSMDRLLDIEREFMEKTESEVDKAITKMANGKYAQAMKEALLNGWDDVVENLKSLGARLIDVADIQDRVTRASLVITDFSAEISRQEAEMSRDGGWIARILGTETIMDNIAAVREKLGAEMEALRAKIAELGDETGGADKLVKRFNQVRAEYDKLANYVPEVWKDITKAIDGTVSSAFASIFNKGKTDWNAFGKKIADDLKTQLLTALYQVTVRKWVFQIVVNVAEVTGLSGLTQAANGLVGGGATSGSSLLGTASNVNSLYNTVSGGGVLGSLAGSSAAYGAAIGTTSIGAGSQAAMLAAQTGAFGVEGAAATAAAAGTISSEAAAAASGLASAASWALPAIGALVYVATNFKKIVGGQKSMGDGIQIVGGFGDGGFSGMMGQDWQKSGGWFGKKKNGVDWSPLNPEIDKAFDDLYVGVKAGLIDLGKRFGDESVAGMLDGFSMQVDQHSFIQVLSQTAEQIGSDLVKSMLGKVAPVVNDVMARTGSKDWAGTLNMMTAQAVGVGNVLKLIGRSLTDDFPWAKLNDILWLTDNLVQSFGSLDALSSAVGTYYQDFYSAEERNATALSKMTEQVTAAGLAMPKTKDEFRALVDSLDLATDSGRQAFVTLMKIAPAFSTVTDAMEQTRAAAEEQAKALATARQGWQNKLDVLTGVTTDRQLQLQADLASTTDATTQSLIRQVYAQEDLNSVAQQRATLENQILQLQGDTNALRAQELAALDESNKALQEQIYALQDAAAIAQERTNLENQLLQMQGNTTELRARELAALDPSNRALQEQIYALEDAKTAAEEAKTAADALAQAQADAAQQAAEAARTVEAIAQERLGLEKQLWQLQGDTVKIREKELEALNPANRALQEQIWLLQDQAEAAQRLAQIESERMGLQKQLWQLQGNTAALRAAELEALDPSNRALQRQIWALQDSKAAADEWTQTWESLNDSLREQARKLRSELGGTASTSSLLAQFTQATARARVGDSQAAGQLVGLSDEIMSSYKNSAKTSLDMARMAATLAASLEMTAGANSNTSHLTQPTQTASKTDQNTSLMLEEIQLMRSETKAQAQALARLTLDFSKVVVKWDRDGMPPNRVEAA